MRAAEWRIMSLEAGTAAAHLARSEALWQEVAVGAAPPTLRWYTYDAPALVLGVGQDASVADEAACRRAGVQIVRRTSGGTAVLADASLLALDVALPSAHPLAGHDVLEAYRWVGEAFAGALREAAPPAGEAGQGGQVDLVSVAEARLDQAARREAAPGTAAALRALACHGTLSPHEVVLARPTGDGALAGAAARAKLAGLSQVRKRGVVLHQAGLYTFSPGAGVAARLAGLLAVPEDARPPLAGELAQRMASLADLQATAGEPKAGSAAGAVAALVRAFERRAAAALLGSLSRPGGLRG